jgi:hypothetical protein
VRISTAGGETEVGSTSRSLASDTGSHTKAATGYEREARAQTEFKSETGDASTPGADRPQSPTRGLPSPVPRVISRGYRANRDPASGLRGRVAGPVSLGESPAANTTASSSSVSQHGHLANSVGSISPTVKRPEDRSGDGEQKIAFPGADGWVEEFDPVTSRKFFVNHEAKKWSWHHPQASVMHRAAVSRDNGPGLPGAVGTPCEHTTSENFPATPPPPSSQGFNIRHHHPNEVAGSSNLATSATSSMSKRDCFQKGVQAGGNDDDSAPTSMNHLQLNYLQVFHEREMQELKSEIRLIRSKPRNRRTTVADPRDLPGSFNSPTPSCRESPLTKIEISQIRKAPYRGSEGRILPGNAGNTYRQLEAEQYGLSSPCGFRNDLTISTAFSNGSLTARGRIETAPNVMMKNESQRGATQYHDWNAKVIEARLALKEAAPSLDGHSAARIAAAFEELISEGSKMHAKMMSEGDAGGEEDTRGKVKEPWCIKSLSCEQQTYLSEDLQRCSVIISSEKARIQKRIEECKTQSEHVAYQRAQVDAQVEEQREEIMHVQRGIKIPTVEDMVLLAQLSETMENLMISREKHLVRVETLRTSRQHLEEEDSLLQHVHGMLHDHANKLELEQGRQIQHKKVDAKLGPKAANFTPNGAPKGRSVDRGLATDASTPAGFGSDGASRARGSLG